MTKDDKLGLLYLASYIMVVSALGKVALIVGAIMLVTIAIYEDRKN